MFTLLVKFLYKINVFLKPYLIRIVPLNVLLFLKKKIIPGSPEFQIENVLKQDWYKARNLHLQTRNINEGDGGVNIVGYLKAAKGISEAARNSITAINTTSVLFSVNDFEYGIPEPQQVEIFPISRYRTGFNFNTNLLHVNPPQLPYLWYTYKKKDLTSKYNIGVWYWELTEIPDEWRFAFGVLDEVWVATEFIFNSVSAKSPIPVVKMPPCVQVEIDVRLNRSHFDLPNDRFLFMCAYDVLSVQERKNPLGAIRAFKLAFKKDDLSVGMVIKINNAASNPIEVLKLKKEIEGYSNFYIIEDVFDKRRFSSLIKLVDVYVSLHRSEGFGLIPAEAMCLGKPVIMTRWSGNTDFMTGENSCGVDYKLIPIKKEEGPYQPGQVWADPDVEQASDFMRRLYSDNSFYSNISVLAGKTIQDIYSPEKVGLLMKDRLQNIGLI